MDRRSFKHPHQELNTTAPLQSGWSISYDLDPMISLGEKQVLLKQVKVKIGFAALLVCVVASFQLSAQPTPLQVLTSPDGPWLQVLERNAQGTTVRTEANWTVPLNTVIEQAFDLENAGDLIRRISTAYPVADQTLTLPSLQAPSVRVAQADYDELDVSSLPESIRTQLAEALPATPAEAAAHGISRGRVVGSVQTWMLTFDPQTNLLRRYRQVVARVQYGASLQKRPRNGQNNPHLTVDQSVLAEGRWFKFPVQEEGLYQIDRAYLTSLGLNPSSIDPANLRIYGNGGEPLPVLAGAPRPVDLVENPVLAQGGEDGRFDDGDRVLFFAQGPTGWRVDPDLREWNHYVHPFSNDNVYFIRVDAPDGAKLADPTFPNDPAPTVLTSFQARRFVERDIVNLGQSDNSGSGHDWLGQLLDREVPRRTVLELDTPGRQAGEVQFRSRVVASAAPAVTLSFYESGNRLAQVTPPPVFDFSTATERSARDVIHRFESTLTGIDGALNVDLEMTGGDVNAKGWLDWLEVYYPRTFVAQNDYLRFSTPLDETGTFEMVLTGFSQAPQVWDVTEPGSITRVATQTSGSGHRIQVQSFDPLEPRELVAFVPTTGVVRTPAEAEAVGNQNLHGLTAYPDFVIVVPEVFRDQAEELAEHRRREDLKVLVSDVQQIYNEFSGGVQDVRAVRDYFKFLYDRARTTPGVDTLRYALLFGDGHYDFRNLTEDDENPHAPNWILPYQTPETLHRDASYTSDDYFGLLDDEEGLWRWQDKTARTGEQVDLGIGRFPVQTPDQAQAVVDKIKRYESPATFGPWRTRYTFIADDGPAGSKNDKDLHTQNADEVAKEVARLFGAVNLNKVYAISYPAQTTVVGRRVPEAKEDILASIREGTLVWNYSGHGGWNGLADEKLFVLEDIDDLENADKLPIFVTATCSFGAFDKTKEQSGAERLVYKPDGGGIAAFTTVRIVFTSSGINTLNLGLNIELNRHLLERDKQGRPLRFGDVMLRTKNSPVGAQSNNRKFNLLGDPTMRIALPLQQVVLERVNGQRLAGGAVPLRALDLVRLEGSVVRQDSTLEAGFSGVLDFTVFDAEREILIPEELRRSLSGGRYSVRNDLIYQGEVTVEQGRFQAQFVVPKDISYSNATGRIALYARNGETDALGVTEEIVVGGTSANPVHDTEGPEINLFLGDSTFISGGITGESPELLIRLFDTSGINTIGTGVGHELLLVIDDQEQNAVELGDRYEGALNSYQRGEVRYTLPELGAGPHSLHVRAWDVVNNSSTAQLDFVVVPEVDLTVANVFNYPNPMVDHTRFAFEHNQPAGTLAEVELRIYTVGGQLIKRIESFDTLPTGALPAGLVQFHWDGYDDDFDRVGRGVYLYKLRVEVENLDGERQVSEHLGKLAVIH